MKAIPCVAVLALLAASSTTVTARQLDPCTLLTVDEIKSALGRKDLSPGKSIRESDDFTVCLFAEPRAGDVVVMLPRVSVNTQRDFELLRGITLEHVEVSETIPGVGDGAFYYNDQIDFRVGSRMVSLLVDRTPRTEAPAAVKAALTSLAKRITERLRDAG